MLEYLASTKVSNHNNLTFVKAAVGRNHFLFLSSRGELWVKGANHSGQLGLKSKGSYDRLTHVPLPPLSFIATGDHHSLVITTKGVLYSTGYNNYGQLGLDDCLSRCKFTRIATPAAVAFASAGEYYSYIITMEGRLYICGVGGSASNFELYHPFTEIVTPAPIKKIVTSVYGSAILTMKGKIYTKGNNGYGELGTGDRIRRRDYVPSHIPSSYPIIELVAGSHHLLALASDGKAWACGYNYKGQLALGDERDRYVFCPIRMQSLIHLIAAGDYYSCVVTDGLLWMFGKRNGRITAPSFIIASKGKCLLLDEDGQPYTYEERIGLTKIEVPIVEKKKDGWWKRIKSCFS